MTLSNQREKKEDRSWEQVVRRYNQPVISKSVWQIVNTFIPYFALFYLMYISLQHSYWLTLGIAVIASFFLIRIFIIFHDCGHGSFFKNSKAGNIIGFIAGVLTFTAYRMWHYHHRIHHATAVNLDKRGIGDVWTMTKEEYLNSSRWDRTVYRLFRNPILMFTVGPLYAVLILNRFSKKSMKADDKLNLYLTNLAILLVGAGLTALIGLKAYLLIQIPVILIAHSIGIWLFLIQHNFEDIEWERNDSWDYKMAALKGCSFLKFPPVFQWFTGSIGFHHVHHLSPKIPNYNLARCHYENDIFHEVKPITFLQTFKFLNLHLWDEKNQKMIRFSEILYPAPVGDFNYVK